MSITTSERPQQIELERGLKERDYMRSVFPVWKRARIWLRRRLSYLQVLACVLELSVRNLAGHIEILLSKNSYADCGPMAEEKPTKHLFWNRRTCACVQGIQELRTRYPWASMVEDMIFLEGFRKGEEFARRLPDIPLVEIPPTAWVDPTRKSAP